eukprot:gnl/TRDRNA2_/TRDRNA2_169058_c0_seq1.p1 gnl/TRDRNA2_/TRDRNA2_169058_c0~~gnl/TRDRNA2_/TRDRNA2_169058_c0_seq1.p1  ORF type:complete len:447 (-),score=62.34 gnl/TRDRNA2_/TRDRNA2_169058_c0_seq1:145-1485(-)
MVSRAAMDHSQLLTRSDHSESSERGGLSELAHRSAASVILGKAEHRNKLIDLNTLPRLSTDDLAEGADVLRPFVLAPSGQQWLPRIMDRKCNFNQSMGRFNIRRKAGAISRQWLHKVDPFHSIVNMGTIKLLTLSASVIIISWLLFALLFLMISKRCDLRANTFLKSLYLSIETVETIGYGVFDSYFNSCEEGIFVLGASALWESLLNAVIISVVYTRISRGQSRASSICFSDKAVIIPIEGRLYFMFQVCDFRKHQLCEAHTRCYCIQHAETNTGITFQTRAMRLQLPDDELGGMLLPIMPQLIVHRIDAWSPLYPAAAGGQREGCTPADSYRFPEIPQRAADGENGNREVHPSRRHEQVGLAELAQHIARSEFEVISLVEGIDPGSSNSLQARHSYACEDIVFNATFVRCVSRAVDGACEIHFEDFHKLVELDNPAEDSRRQSF